MPINVTAGIARRRLAAALACASIAAGAACTQVVAETSACRKLEYKNGSVPRSTSSIDRPRQPSAATGRRDPTGRRR